MPQQAHHLLNLLSFQTASFFSHHQVSPVISPKASCQPTKQEFESYNNSSKKWSQKFTIFFLNGNTTFATAANTEKAESLTSGVPSLRHCKIQSLNLKLKKKRGGKVAADKQDLSNPTAAYFIAPCIICKELIDDDPLIVRTIGQFQFTM